MQANTRGMTITKLLTEASLETDIYLRTEGVGTMRKQLTADHKKISLNCAVTRSVFGIRPRSIILHYFFFITMK